MARAPEVYEKIMLTKRGGGKNNILGEANGKDQKSNNATKKLNPGLFRLCLNLASHNNCIAQTHMHIFTK